MTERWRFAIVRGPRRWEARRSWEPPPSTGAGGWQCETSPGWWTDHPSAGAGVRTAAKLSSEPPRDWWIGQPSVARPSEVAGQGVPRAHNRIQVTAQGRGWAQARMPCPSSSPPRAASRCGAGRVGEPGLARSRGHFRHDPPRHSAPIHQSRKTLRDAIKTLTDRYDLVKAVACAPTDVRADLPSYRSNTASVRRCAGFRRCAHPGVHLPPSVIGVEDQPQTLETCSGGTRSRQGMAASSAMASCRTT